MARTPSIRSKKLKNQELFTGPIETTFEILEGLCNKPLLEDNRCARCKTPVPKSRLAAGHRHCELCETVISEGRG